MTAKTKSADKAEINAPDSKSKYWGIKHGEEIIFEGTFEQCWQGLHEKYPNATMTTFMEQGIRIARIK